MCSIPGLPTPGSEVPVLITRVNLNYTYGLVELWVNVDDGRKHVYEQMREKIQTPERKFYGSEGKPGDLCLVCISDTWHRARIVSIQSEACHVFLIDQGQPHITTSEALAWGQSDIFLLPPETESCILANVLCHEKNWPEKATKFLVSLPGKKVKGLVQHVLMPDRTILLDIPVFSKHVSKLGVAKKMPVDEFKCLVQKCLEADRIMQEQNLNVSCQLEKHDHYFYPELLTDTFETVYVTAVTNPHDIFCKVLIFSKAVKILSEQIQKYYEESSDVGETRPLTCGDPCAARGINGRWHRSLLKQTMTSDGTVEVLHVDEGKTELIPIGDIRPLHVKFLRMPVVTYSCSLEGVKDNGTGWTTDQTDYLKSALLNQTVVVKFTRHSIPEDVYHVILYAENYVCINNCFIEMEEPSLPPKTVRDTNVQNESITSLLLRDECWVDLQNKVSVNVDALPEETLPHTKNLAVSGKTDNALTFGADDTEIKVSSECPDPLVQVNGKLSNASPSDVLNACDAVKCIVKAATSDGGGLLNMVDCETSSDSECKLLTQKCAQAEALVQSPPQVPLDAYIYSTHNIEVNGKEKVWVTSCENVHQFYCQLERNCQYFDKVMGNVNQLIGQPQNTDHPLGLNSICLAKYTDKKWYRAQVEEMSPKLKVHFVDYGHSLEVNESDICPFPPEASMVKSVPVQAVPLGLSNVPADVPQEVNQWFAECAVGQSFTISVVAKEENGKLLVELFEGPQNVNVNVRGVVANMMQQQMTSVVQQLSNSPEHARVLNGDCPKQELKNVSVLMKMTEQNKVHSINGLNGLCARDELNSQSITTASAPQTEHEKTLHEGRKPALDVIVENKEIEGDSEMTQLSLPSCPKGNINMYKWPNIPQNATEVYASCIVEPHFFWCQYADTEELSEISRLAQEAGQAPEDMRFPETLGSGSPCLALFSSDNQWYRALVESRVDDVFHVVFIDYGNESDVDIKNVRSLPQSLLEKAPQAFLCSLDGFDESKGSWDDQVYEGFYNLLVDKPLRVKVFNMEDHSQIAVPQYAVKIECDNVVLNSVMQKYWKPLHTEHAKIERTQTETSLQDIQTESNMTDLKVSKENVNTCLYKKPNISKNKKEEVYASCIVEPHFFWCQYANTEELSEISKLVQEAGQAQQDVMFPETLGPGNPCLALFSSDNQWYRAQVIRRVEDAFDVTFIDYGNESDVDVKNVRSLPQSLLERAPQAFLCSLNGFDKSRGSWDDEVYDDFYNLLVNKPLKLTVFDMDDHSEAAVPQYAVEIECDAVVVNAAMQKYWKPVAKRRVSFEHPPTKTFIRNGQTESSMTQLSVAKEDVKSYMYKWPKLSQNKTEVYASCIVEPHFFWCQYADTEELSKISKLVQEAGQAQQDVMFPETLGPGNPCLALFSSDNQWYRAQVIRRVEDAFDVTFIDYGNESDVDVKNVRSLPQSLLEKAPQAFLCSLNGFDQSRGSWDDEVYDDFYNLLVNKPLKLTVFDMDDHSEAAVPQYAVEVECDGVVVNTLMKKYWKGLDANHALAGRLGSVDPHDGECWSLK
ncbi:tudor domain-containing 6 [Epinephelus fuscoguttatus]|uniref:tudor domain-containing 6 n=1 Tax=Epinephelus fuscoguttatus TaxID=293821 RepID=UPI0020D19FD2|nr:tudor domain-containing 6 [Epinephelus fuscoguttatus]